MSSSRLRSSLACEACRIRKYKCSKDRPSCTSCIKQDRVCNYVPMPAKTPLTRQYVTYLEDRVRKLETEMAGIPSSSRAPTMKSTKSYEAESGKITHLDSRQSDITQPPLLRPPSENKPPQDLPPELLPQSSDGFDWVEEEFSVDEISDGMAALSVRPEGAGYLGASSSVAFLRALLPLGWDLDVQPPTSVNQIDQSRYFQPTALSSPRQALNAATPRHLMTALIDAYFLYYHTSYPFIHEATFRAQFNEQVPQPKGHAWPMLLNAVLALGSWCIGDENSNLDDGFYQVAIRYSEKISVFESGSLTLVQALLLLSNYAQKRNKPNTGWNFLGLAVRIALSLGLHREFPNWNISLLQREVRRRIWWGLFIFDSGASVTFGRPILLPDASLIDVKMVLNIPEESLTPVTKFEPGEIPQPTLYSSLIAQSKFHSISNNIFNRLVSTSQPSAEETLEMSKPINEWFDSLPEFYKDIMAIPRYDWHAFARYRLFWRHWNLLVILYRPFLLRWASASITLQDYAQESCAESKCRSLCIESAHATIISTNEYIANHTSTRLSSWYALYFLFQASLIPTICLCTDPLSPEAPSWSADIQTTKALLTHAFSTNPLAARCLKVIDRLVTPTPSSMTGDDTVASQWDLMAEPDRFFDEIYSLSSLSSLTGGGMNSNEAGVPAPQTPRWDMLNGDMF